jgi:hypothetical protein
MASLSALVSGLDAEIGASGLQGLDVGLVPGLLAPLGGSSLPVASLGLLAKCALDPDAPAREASG